MRVEIVPPEEEQPVLPAMEAHKLDPNTGEDEMAVARANSAQASLAPAANADSPTAIRATLRVGARSAATRIVLAAQARSTSTATATLESQGGRALTAF